MPHNKSPRLGLGVAKLVRCKYGTNNLSSLAGKQKFAPRRAIGSPAAAQSLRDTSAWQVNLSVSVTATHLRPYTGPKVEQARKSALSRSAVPNAPQRLA